MQWRRWLAEAVRQVVVAPPPKKTEKEKNPSLIFNSHLQAMMPDLDTDNTDEECSADTAKVNLN